MTARELLWIDEEQVAANLSLAEAIDIVEKSFVAESRGAAIGMEKTHVAWPGGGLHALGGASTTSGFAGTKTWTHTEAGATPLFVLFRSDTGALAAVIEAFALGQLRTAAVSAVATRWLAPADAAELALVGTGRQALAQLAAVAHVRRIRRVRVFSPNAERRGRFVKALRAEFFREIVECASLAEAVSGAPIVTAVTRATEPFLRAADLAPGAHLNAIGAITPERAEIAGDVLARAGRIVVDELPAARRLSRELREALGDDAAGWSRVETLAHVVGAKHARDAGADLTVFKGLGSGLADLALAVEAFHRVERAGGGREIPQPERTRPQLLPGGID